MDLVMEGSIAVKAAINGKKREIKEIWVRDHNRNQDQNYILKLATQRGIKIKFKPLETINQVAAGKTHGGIIAYCSPREYDDLDQLLANKEPIFLAYLEGIEDPYNYGYALRTLYAAGCQGLIVPKREWGTEETTIAKSSAGTLECLPICLYDDETIAKLKKRGVKIVVAGRKDAVDLYQADFRSDCLIAIGGPLRGLAKPIVANCELTIDIPYANDFRNALNTGSALAVIAYEVYRQRH